MDQPQSVTPVPQASRFRQNPRVAQQVLAGKAVILHYEGKRMLGLNESGSLVWSLLDGSRTIAELSDEIAALTGRTSDEVEPQLLAFIEGLRARELVVDAGESGTGSEGPK